MSAGSLFFAVCAIACIVGALATVLAKSPVRAAVGLLTTIVGIAGLFLKLNAEFLAAIQLIVYAGAIVVLFVFVLMLLGPDASGQTPSKRARFAKTLSAVLLVIMGVAVAAILVPSGGVETRFMMARPEHGSVEAVGGLIFEKGLVPFELSTALLIVAVVGAIAVARGKQGKKKSRHPASKPSDYYAGPVHPRDVGHPLPKEPVR
jgi:NADH-quinone oxidoreductase subunit J